MMDVAPCHHSTKSFPLQGVVLSQVPSRASLLTQESYSTHYLLGNSAITPCMKVDFHESTPASTHRGLLRHGGLSHVAGQTPSFSRSARPVVLRPVVWLPEFPCHRRMGTQRRHRYRSSPWLHAQHALCLNAAHHLSVLRPRGVCSQMGGLGGACGGDGA